MKDILKFALSAFGIFLVVILLALMFVNVLVADSQAARWIAFGVMVLIIAFLGVVEGGTRGEADAAHQRLMEKREADRGIEPTAYERQRFFKTWKGFVSGMIASSPWVLFALFVVAMGAMGRLDDWMTVAMRALLLPFISIFPEDVSITWYYPLLAVIYPVAIGTGYLMGPRRFSKILKAINENNQKRLQKQRAKRRPQSR